MGSCYIAQGAQPVLCDDLEGKDEEIGREAQEGGDIHARVYVCSYN